MSNNFETLKDSLLQKMKVSMIFDVDTSVLTKWLVILSNRSEYEISTNSGIDTVIKKHQRYEHEVHYARRAFCLTILFNCTRIKTVWRISIRKWETNKNTNHLKILLQI